MPVTFESDFSTSRATTKLIVLSSAGPLTFALRRNCHTVLPMCRAQLRCARAHPKASSARVRRHALLLVALVALGQLTLKAAAQACRDHPARLVPALHAAEATKEATPSAPGEGGAARGKPVAARRVPPPAARRAVRTAGTRQLPAAALASAQTNGAAAHAPLKVVVPAAPTPRLRRSRCPRQACSRAGNGSSGGGRGGGERRSVACPAVASLARPPPRPDSAGSPRPRPRRPQPHPAATAARTASALPPSRQPKARWARRTSRSVRRVSPHPTLTLTLTLTLS